MSDRLQDGLVIRAHASNAGAAFLLLGCSAASPSQPGLCEVAANRASYAGKTITVEGALLVSKHGSAVVDRVCNEGVPIEWSESDVPQLRELGVVVERALAEPMTIRIRVTGEMKRGPRSQLAVEPYWYLDLSRADVLNAQPTENTN